MEWAISADRAGGPSDVARRLSWNGCHIHCVYWDFLHIHQDHLSMMAVAATLY